TFGELAHDVLSAFGADARAASTDVGEIVRLLEELLEALVADRFGKSARPAVAVQVAQLKLRLQAFARAQAAQAQAGWRIQRTELEVKQAACVLDVDGRPFHLVGRVDRIDQNEITGEWAIWDYKTSDTAAKPEVTHRKGGEWIDLQLPLYRRLAAAVVEPMASILEVDGRVQLGYVQLPKSLDAIRFETADWTAADLQAADERARDVVRALREQVFWPPADPPPKFSEDLAGICLDGVFGRRPPSPEGDDEEGA
ncbi:MAG: PD-(D/E)XK nuclease family protein, partial [Planctomycetales bacterium]|nr:PD-(D/E)XK nuclease family protein [Planctomycetales bacterium]